MWALWKMLVRPVLFRVDAERAHDLGMLALRSGLSPKLQPDGALKTFLAESFGPIKRFGLTYVNPIGLAAGFDKNGLAVEQLGNLGFGSVEIGTVTFEPQGGNPKPRIFRLPQQQALINRLGFNNDGAAAVADRLKRFEKGNCVIGINIGRNKEIRNEDAIRNYEQSFDLLSPLADYVTVNVSSPNTPNLRDLQHVESLKKLLVSLQGRNTAGKPLLVKIAPDLTESDVEAIVDLCLELGVSGVIATNTTVSREGIPAEVCETIGPGGLSGKPLREMSTAVISTIYRCSKGKLPVIGVGGIFTAEDAFAKIAAGACLIQAYTGLIYHGPTFARDISIGLAKILRERGFRSFEAAIGSDVKIEAIV
jgi:dihydroorotate dehydrogenase